MQPLPDGVVIRHARPDELAAFGALCRRTFAEGFAYAYTPDAIARHLDAVYTPEALHADLTAQDRVTLVASRGDDLAAYVVLRIGAKSDGVTAARPWEIARFYVDRAWHGGGLAGPLMEEALRLARVGGADAAWLGVWEHNARAIRFYEKMGFQRVGGQIYVFDGRPENDYVMARAL